MKSTQNHYNKDLVLSFFTLPISRLRWKWRNQFQSTTTKIEHKLVQLIRPNYTFDSETSYGTAYMVIKTGLVSRKFLFTLKQLKNRRKQLIQHVNDATWRSVNLYTWYGQLWLKHSDLHCGRDKRMILQLLLGLVNGLDDQCDQICLTKLESCLKKCSSGDSNVSQSGRLNCD